MADEQNEQTQVEQPSPAAPEQVVVEGTPVKDESKVDPAKDFASSPLPYHTAETEKIQADRANEQEGKEAEPYEYKFNGYTVTEVEQANPQATAPEDGSKMWKVTAEDAGDFEQFFSNRRAAEIFVETHSPQFAKNAVVKNAPAVQDIPKT